MPPPQDPDFPVSELLYHSPDSKGWCTPRCGGLWRCGGGGLWRGRAGGGPFILLTCVFPPFSGLALATHTLKRAPQHSTQHSAPPLPAWLCRFSQYPQELTLRLEGAARLAQVQLLSHEFKIAAKVELLVGTFEGGLAAVSVGAGPGGAAAAAAVDPAKASWRRLGFLSFDSNERSSFTARELKSVALSGTPAHLLRLVFHRCHANAANLYSQVGARQQWQRQHWGRGCIVGSWVLLFRLVGAAPTSTCACRHPPGSPLTLVYRSAWWLST